MPSQRLLDRFDIITRISSGIVQVFLVRERTSGKDALLREVPVDGSSWKPEQIADKAKNRIGDLDPDADLANFADADLSEDRRKAWVVVWAVKEAEAAPAIAALAADFTPTAAVIAPAAPAETPFPSTPAASVAASGQGGDFTRLFAAKPAARHIQTAEPISLVGANAPPPEAVRVTPPSSAKPMEAGEFTRMFGSPTLSAPTSTQPIPPAPPSTAVPVNSPTAPVAKGSEDELHKVLDLFSTGTAAKTTTPQAPVAPPSAVSETGGFTQIFGVPSKSPMGEPHAVVPTSPAKPVTAPSAPPKADSVGDFTRTFGSSSHAPIGETPTAPVSKDPFAAAVESGPPAQANAPGPFTQIFTGSKLTGPDPALRGPAAARSSSNDWRVSPPPAPPVAPKSANPSPFGEPQKAAGPGEFTKMFQTPHASSSGAIPTAPVVSDSVFPSAPAAPAHSSGPGELTQLFSMKPSAAHEAPAKDPFASFTPAPASSGGGESLTQLLSQAPKPAASAPATSSPAAPPAPAFPATSTAFPQAGPLGQPGGSGATRIFSQPEQPAPAATPAPSGPSEYTRIISTRPASTSAVPPPNAPAGGGSAFAGAMPEVAGPQISGPQFSGPQFSAPQVSGPQFSGPQMSAPQMSGPQFAAPQMSGAQFTPPSLQAPSMQAPSMQAPQMSAPAMNAPAAAAEKKPLGGYLPLIIILNVLVILAIVLVLYFALRHH